VIPKTKRVLQLLERILPCLGLQEPQRLPQQQASIRLSGPGIRYLLPRGFMPAGRGGLRAHLQPEHQ
jgi:hypothetical protein